ncbi:MAG: hypothetical protein AAGL68_01075 [Pseudomonadota bacterium]
MNADTKGRSGVLGRGPAFWGGLMFLSYAALGGLAMAGAIEDVTLLILMMMPLVLMVPLMKSANQRVDAGGDNCTIKGEAQKRYLKRVAISTSIYLLAMAGLVFAENAEGIADSWRVLAAIPPGLAIIGVFWAIGRLIVEEQDEFIRMLVIRQSLIATGIALSAATIWGFLETADVVPHADAYWWAVIWFAGLAVGAVSNRLEYGAWGAV